MKTLMQGQKVQIVDDGLDEVGTVTDVADGYATVAIRRMNGSLKRLTVRKKLLQTL